MGFYDRLEGEGIDGWLDFKDCEFLALLKIESHDLGSQTLTLYGHLKCYLKI